VTYRSTRLRVIDGAGRTSPRAATWTACGDRPSGRCWWQGLHRRGAGHAPGASVVRARDTGDDRMRRNPSQITRRGVTAGSPCPAARCPAAASPHRSATRRPTRPDARNGGR
jgi:hypothetical protein